MNILSFPFHKLHITWDKSKLPQMHPLLEKTRIRFHTLKTHVFSVCISSLQLLSKMHIVQRCTDTIEPVFSCLYSVLRKSLWYTESKHQTRTRIGPNLCILVFKVSKYLDASAKLMHMNRIFKKKKERESKLWVTHSSKTCAYFRMYFRKTLPHKGFRCQ